MTNIQVISYDVYHLSNPTLCIYAVPLLASLHNDLLITDRFFSLFCPPYLYEGKGVLNNTNISYTRNHTAEHRHVLFFCPQINIGILSTEIYPKKLWMES